MTGKSGNETPTRRVREGTCGATGVWVCAVTLLLVACSSENGGDEGPPGACRNLDVCEALPVSRVNSALGGPFSYPVAVRVADVASGTPSDECSYAQPGTTGLSIVRTCSDDEFGPSQFDQEHAGEVTPPNTRTDLGGVGDRAFVVDVPNGSPNGSVATLLAIKGKVLARIDDRAVRPGQDVHDGLATLANLLFSQ